MCKEQENTLPFHGNMYVPFFLFILAVVPTLATLKYEDLVPSITVKTVKGILLKLNTNIKHYPTMCREHEP